MNPRTLTPSMSLLLAFEAAARHESYTRAAHELSLTQSAVSRQVQILKDARHAPVQPRRPASGVDRCRAHVSARTGRSPRADPQRDVAGHGVRFSIHSLRLATLPTFGSKWLLPRLKDFYTAHPGMTVHLHSRIEAIDFDTSEIDAAICVGGGEWPGLSALPLHTEELVVIASAQLSPAERDDAEQHIAGQLLLNVSSNAQAWAEWFTHHGLPHRSMRIGPSFEMTSHLIQAVRANIGVGLVPRILVEDELLNGELLQLGSRSPAGAAITWCIRRAMRRYRH
jgi:DNA-binding transcriptional LysR family regulator